MEDALRAELERRRRSHLLRRREILEGAQGVEPLIDGRRYLAFCSNDYLGLANDPRIIEAMQRGAARYGAGSGASHLVTGHSRAHHALEEELAAFVGRERALLFSTGYMANLGVASALVGRGDGVFQDRLNHASLIDAALLAHAHLRRYAHGDVAQLERALERSTAKRKLVLTDGVFSMDGDMAPLPALAVAARRAGAVLAVDDAHGVGVVGARGRGTLEHYGLGPAEVPVLVGTLGKAFGTFGAFVAGGHTLVETVLQAARTYVYTTALPPSVAEATRTALRIVCQEGWRREHLRTLVRRFRDGAAHLGLPLMPSESPIQPLLLGETTAALQAADALRVRGIYITAMRPPTVPRGTARLRIAFSAAHQSVHVDRLLDALGEVVTA
ncbi:MAG: 8-amino-7-oxononanoate synthase [Gammaproteobacteria bacterium]|nr:8-amino-7-oxononanoate synthase [Gammaproteobacteria bacterium]NIR82195.1 8-amino-7-oxononanoate synthase [Gammaproteobacteria bacterium]NIR90794.1 8-amino-7-oxononanoate synthase [Gammaproteobacteria bacterium]NIU03345.1 8-amino-7-oxononanoate synthase [Gammaproteobacteria bacterium]NIV50841.1 8-amino-7-oxononanoate synthase [Gammaproteobacteria bacterium]